MEMGIGDATPLQHPPFDLFRLSVTIFPSKHRRSETPCRDNDEISIWHDRKPNLNVNSHNTSTCLHTIAGNRVSIAATVQLRAQISPSRRRREETLLFSSVPIHRPQRTHSGSSKKSTRISYNTILPFATPFSEPT